MTDPVLLPTDAIRSAIRQDEEPRIPTFDELLKANEQLQALVDANLQLRDVNRQLNADFNDCSAGREMAQTACRAKDALTEAQELIATWKGAARIAVDALTVRDARIAELEESLKQHLHQREVWGL